MMSDDLETGRNVEKIFVSIGISMNPKSLEVKFVRAGRIKISDEG
jgi:hypothetical protein